MMMLTRLGVRPPSRPSESFEYRTDTPASITFTYTAQLQRAVSTFSASLTDAVGIPDVAHRVEKFVHLVTY
jgi:hypothetical protein